MKDVIIIGSGPAGYTAAVYTARADLAPLVVAGSVDAGGELMKTTEVENFPGFPDGIMGPELMGALQRQSERFGAEIRYDDVTSMDLRGAVKRITLSGGETEEARAVILATGSAYRMLGVPGEDLLMGHGVSACATCDGFFFRDRDIAVVGGGDSAMEEATFLTKFARHVTVIHRRDSLRASKIMQERAFADPKIDFLWNTEVVALNGDGSLSSATVRNTLTGDTREFPLDGLFVAIGNNPRTELVADQLDLTPTRFIAVDGRSSRTSLPGVFAAGDVIDPTYRQAVTAAGSGCIAALDAERYLVETGASTSPSHAGTDTTPSIV